MDPVRARRLAQQEDSVTFKMWKSMATGFKTDCQKLIEQFVATGNVRYEEFSRIWREMNFSFIFFGRETEQELFEFTEEAFSIAKCFWLPPNNFQVRVCGLYLVFALYVKQPLKPSVKVRVTITEWQHCRTFVEEAVTQHHWDVVFIFARLQRDLDAFNFVFFEAEVDTSLKGMELIRDTEDKMKRSSVDSVLVDYVNRGGFNVLESIHGRYEAIKKQLVDSDSKLLLRMTDRNAFAQVSRVVAECSAAVSRVEAADAGHDDIVEEEISQDIGQHRAALKARQMAVQMQEPRHDEGQAVSSED